MKTPVAFLIFNRPETTARVFAEIARARPEKLLVVADGPRDGRPEEAERCRATRAVVERVDWECEVLTDYAETNLGCKARIASGLGWVFEQVAEAIILEDDCLPHPSFFPFCEELLERYRDDERVSMISGDNFQRGQRRTPYSYYFSRYPHIWGWASWRRAWQHYDPDIKYWQALRKTDWLRDILGDDVTARYWQAIFDNVAAGRATTWDYQWLFACWAQNGFAVAPEVNLISNIGFGADSTHTATPDETANLPAGEMLFPLRHPPYFVRERAADDFESEFVFKCAASERRWAARARRKLSTLMP
ncbi:MAG TPA: hypothetical protein VNA19_07030 [Pyrinomonadaceae bacterium]|nr:hypothetical protein [Pyrinomonadaceae bacterium]